MPKSWRAANFIEPVTDSMAEQFGNAANYCVVSGCEPQYSGSGLSVTVSAGVIKHNGATVTVAGSSATLVPDATNPLWAWITLDSSGAAGVTHGTASANPTVPEHGDTVPVCLILVEANQTIAARCATKLDKRMIGLRTVTATGGGASVVLSADYAATTTTAAVPGFELDVAANTTYSFRTVIGYVAQSVGYQVVFAGPAGSTVEFLGIDYNLAATAQLYPSNGTIFANAFGASTPGVIHASGILIVGSTAGKFQYKHAAMASTGTFSVKSKSRIELF